MPLEKILILDDEPIVRKLLEDIFKRKKCTVATAASIAEADALLAKDTYDLMMVDVHLPDGDGEHMLERVTALPERPIVVMMTGNGTVESAVACMRAGAFDYLIKPFSMGQIDIVLRKAETFQQLVNVNRYLSNEGGEGELLGRSPAMQRLRQLITRVAPTDATVLITGENGTGKEMVAREIFRHSQRRSEAYIKVNCAAVSENLIESEFFGHERGAFTGATDRREGRFELANRGTLLLDEVSEIPHHLQAKLLRVLQEREFERVGGNKTIKVNVRILATSNRDLLLFAEKGNFRQDLYYRLNVFPVHVPALRDRPDDIIYLAEHFLKRAARRFGLQVRGFSDKAQEMLRAYPWPGNVREMQNTVERAVILADSGRPVGSSALCLPALKTTVSGFHPPDGNSKSPVGEKAGLSMAAPSEPAAATPTYPEVADQPRATAVAETAAVIPLHEMEKHAILAALRQNSGNRTQASAQLQISIRTLRNKIQEYRESGETIPGGED